jgi:polysaccharide export outer membrane protein
MKGSTTAEPFATAQHGLALVLALSLLIGGAGCASYPPPPPEEVNIGAFSPESPAYVIGPSDVLRVQVWRSPELSADVPVRPDGRISLPLLEDVHVAGLTTGELREKLAEEFSEYVSAPDVSVIVAQVNSKRVHVVGEVNRPGPLPLVTEMRVLDAISLVGGFSPFANKRKVRILRPAEGGAVDEYRFNYSSFLSGNDPETNLILRPGDTIVVQE